MSLPGYDAWKLASPPEYDAPDTCPECGEEYEGVEPRCANCGYGEPPEMGLRERDERDRMSEVAAIGRARMR